MQWRFRYLLVFVITAVLLTIATIFTQGIGFVLEDPYPLVGLILLFGVACCVSLYGERGLASRVVIRPEGLEIFRFGSTHLIRYEHIVQRELLNYKSSKNNFRVSEIFLKDTDGGSYYIPTNIKSYEEIEQVLSAHEK